MKKLITFFLIFLVVIQSDIIQDLYCDDQAINWKIPNKQREQCGEQKLFGYFNKNDSPSRTYDLNKHASVDISVNVGILGKVRNGEFEIFIDNKKIDPDTMFFTSENNFYNPKFIFFESNYGHDYATFNCGQKSAFFYTNIKFSINHTFGRLNLRFKFNSKDGKYGINNIDIAPRNCPVSCFNCSLSGICHTQYDKYIDLNSKKFTNNDLNGWKTSPVIYSGSKITTCNNKAYLGGQYVGKPEQFFYKTYSKLRSHYRVKISFKVKFYGEWDKEWLIIRIDEKEYTSFKVIGENYYHRVYKQYRENGCDAFIDRTININVNHENANLTLSIGSNLEKSTKISSIGIRDVKIEIINCDESCKESCKSDRPCVPDKEIISDSMNFGNWLKTHINAIYKSCSYNKDTALINIIISTPKPEPNGKIITEARLLNKFGKNLNVFYKDNSNSLINYHARIKLQEFEGFLCEKSSLNDKSKLRYQIIKCKVELDFMHHSDGLVKYFRAEDFIILKIDLAIPSNSISSYISTKVIELSCNNCKPNCVQNCILDANFTLTAKLCRSYDNNTKKCPDRSNSYEYSEKVIVEYTLLPPLKIPSLFNISVSQEGEQVSIINETTILHISKGKTVVEFPANFLAGIGGRVATIIYISKLDPPSNRRILEGNEENFPAQYAKTNIVFEEKDTVQTKIPEKIKNNYSKIIIFGIISIVFAVIIVLFNFINAFKKFRQIYS